MPVLSLTLTGEVMMTSPFLWLFIRTWLSFPELCLVNS